MCLLIIISNCKHKVTSSIISSICKVMGLWECNRAQNLALNQESFFTS